MTCGIIATNQGKNVAPFIEKIIKMKWNKILLNSSIPIQSHDNSTLSDYELKSILSHFDHFERKFNDFEQNLTVIESESKLTLKLVHIFSYFAQLTTKENMLEDIIRNYSQNRTKLVEKLEHFLQKFENENLSEYIINYVDESSIAVDLRRYFWNEHYDNNCTSISTNNKEIYEIYFSILIKILRSFAVQGIAMEIRKNFAIMDSTNSYDEELDLLNLSKGRVLKKWSRSIGGLSLPNNDHFKSCVEINPKKKIVKFKNVLQIFFENEIADPCNPNARDHLRVKYNMKGCYGRIRNCTAIERELKLKSRLDLNFSV